MIEELTVFAEATVRIATPLALAALGETVAERSGIINLGVEGSIIAGAFGALVGATYFGTTGGVGFALASGAAIGALFAWLVVRWRTDQIIAGTAISMLALGLTGTLYRSWYGTSGAALTIPTIAPIEIPILSAIPIVGRALFVQPATTFALYMLVPVTSWWLFRTHAGLALRACGESPLAARLAGVSVARQQALALVYAGVLGGLAGSVLVLAQSGTFAEGMSAGRGFIAIAIVVLGRWSPAGVLVAAMLFGATGALQTFFQALGSNMPYQLFLALPYVLTLLALGGIAGHTRAPAHLGRVEPPVN